MDLVEDQLMEEAVARLASITFFIIRWGFGVKDFHLLRVSAARGQRPWRVSRWKRRGCSSRGRVCYRPQRFPDVPVIAKVTVCWSGRPGVS
jgi:hypothetical protein